jgi:hypothetical protein
VTSNDLGLGGRDQQKLLAKPELQLQPNIFVKKNKMHSERFRADNNDI